MVYPTVFLIHSATIQNLTRELNSSGEMIVSDTVETIVSCRFVAAKEVLQPGGSSLVGSIKSLPSIVLPPGTTISDLDKIVSTVDGFTGTYTAVGKKVIYEAAIEDISHITCNLAGVV